jgi:hypothetical protein
MPGADIPAKDILEQVPPRAAERHRRYRRDKKMLADYQEMPYLAAIRRAFASSLS